MQSNSIFHFRSKVSRVMEVLLIIRWSPAKQFAFKLCLFTSLILEEEQDALLILLCSSVSKQL